ncbi:reverse transcriptase [Senna tora]|uniref:Reverse transcriptase n=1 Tax=Senna tora TaxID=362788 RepID=A0A834XEB9_9FABA|nr:reverse transcriptase [Senna tora]
MCADMLARQANLSKGPLVVHNSIPSFLKPCFFADLVGVQYGREMSGLCGVALYALGPWVRGWLSSWKSSSLSLAGRITLSKSMAATILVYSMQTTMLSSKGCDEVEKKSRAFIWGDSDNKGHSSVRVLRAKYKCVDDLIPKVGHINTSSRLWKGIADSWKYVQDGMVWLIGDDRVAADFVSASGGWEWGKFDFLLPNEICNLVVVVSLPSNVVRGDHLAWKHSMEKVRSFLWLCGNDHLLTNVVRKRRGIAATDVCAHCNDAFEDLLQTLRDCVKARCIWSILNAKIFDSSHVSNVDPVHAILKLSEKPSNGWVKFNVNAARRENMNLTACGGVARDSDGRFLIGFMRKLGDGSMLNAELWGIVSALVVAWRSGFKKVLVELDCLLAISCDWEVQVVHTHRDGNLVADALASHAFSYSMDLNILHEAPIFLFHVLHANIKGMGSYRFCMG